MTLQGAGIDVVGGGIGGFAAALAASRQGADVTLWERAPDITEVGAGLQISPNGARVLHALGLGQALGAASVRAREVVLRDGETGRAVAHVPIGRVGGFYLVHRADLVAVLRQAAEAAGVQINLNQAIAKIRPQTGQVELVLASGQSRRAGLVIGADGLHSVARRAISPETIPRFTGQVAWRAVVPETAHTDRVEVYMGPERHLVTYPLRGGRQRNIVAVEEREAWTEEGWHHADDPAALVRAFADFCLPVRDMLARVDTPYLWGLFRHDVAPCWHLGRAALLGDAAHPTLPFLAQGANMALEDAWRLTAALSAAPTAEAGLAAYAAGARPRAERIVAAANANARNFHLPPGPGRLVAHGALRMISTLAPWALTARLAWLYRYDVTADNG